AADEVEDLSFRGKACSDGFAPNDRLHYDKGQAKTRWSRWRRHIPDCQNFRQVRGTACRSPGYEAVNPLFTMNMAQLFMVPRPRWAARDLLIAEWGFWCRVGRMFERRESERCTHGRGRDG